MHCGLLNNMASVLMNSGKLDRAVERLSETLALRYTLVKYSAIVFAKKMLQLSLLAREILAS